MAEPVKPHAPYNSPRRRQQAERHPPGRSSTRPSALFEAQGYAATTMAAIAAEAGVALKTVYVAFETKSRLLRALWHLLLRGDQEDVPVGRPPLVPRGARGARPRAAAAPHRPQLAHGQGARRRDPARDPQRRRRRSRRRRAVAAIQSEFYENQRPIVRAVEEHGGLAPGLDVTRATDILWTLNHPDVWHLLVGQRGWTADGSRRGSPTR